MTPLSLAPLPTTRSDGNSCSAETREIGFVDDAVVARLLSPVPVARVGSSFEDLALAADDMDFAGWQLAPVLSASGFRDSGEIADAPPLSFRRATPPALAEFAIGKPCPVGRRWWIAGFAGVLTTLLVTLLLLILSSRQERKDVHSQPPLPTSAAANLRP